MIFPKQILLLSKNPVSNPSKLIIIIIPPVKFPGFHPEVENKFKTQRERKITQRKRKWDFRHLPLGGILALFTWERGGLREQWKVGTFDRESSFDVHINFVQKINHNTKSTLHNTTITARCGDGYQGDFCDGCVSGLYV